MKKVYLVLSDTNFGGAGRVNLLFVEACDKSEFDITVVLPEKSVLEDKFKALGANVITTKYGADRSADIRAVMELYGIFKKGKPDIVHTHASLSARVAAKLYGKCKIVATRHSVFPVRKYYPRRFSGLVNNATADMFIAVSESAKENLVELGVNKEKIEVVLNGSKPLKKIDAYMAKERLGLGNCFAVGIVGRLEEVKGHRYFIEAAKHFDDSVKFLIIGTGTLEEGLKEIAGDNVLFTGHVDDVTEYVNALDVIVNCSYGTEATSMALIEAMSVGKPAVVSDYGGNPYVIKDGYNGYVIQTGNAKQLAARINLLKDNKETYGRMANAAFLRYQSLFTVEKMVKDTENIYRKLLKKQQFEE